MIDSGCQINLAKGNAIPQFYWENTAEMGIVIEGTPIQDSCKV